MQSPLLHWLSLRVRTLLIAAFAVCSLLPPYVPSAASANEEIDIPAQQFVFVEEGFLMKTSSPGQQASRLAYSEGIMYQIKEGDSLQKLSERFGISADTIRWANGLSAGGALRAGKEILILPVDGVVHTVRRGQTLGRIAELYDVPAEVISERNKVKGGFIVAGEELIIPGARPLLASAAIAATGDGDLRFADALPARDIRLPLSIGAETGPGAGPAASAILSQTLLQMPCENCFYTQKFRPGHYAVDIQTRGGGPIFAAEAGDVIRADYGWNGGFGNVIEVDHGNGLVTLYAHNKTLHVSSGDHVSRGQAIADMGNTGLVHGPTGIHLHFEVRVNGVKKNPTLYLE